jgi:hypothetical protein
MKTKIAQSSTGFEPIDITITLETIEDLKNFLVFMSAMCHEESYSDDIPSIIVNGVEFSVDVTNNADCVNQMIDSLQWKQLEKIYAKYNNEKECNLL